MVRFLKLFHQCQELNKLYINSVHLTDPITSSNHGYIFTKNLHGRIAKLVIPRSHIYRRPPLFRSGIVRNYSEWTGDLRIVTETIRPSPCITVTILIKLACNLGSTNKYRLKQLSFGPKRISTI